MASVVVNISHSIYTVMSLRLLLHPAVTVVDTWWWGTSLMNAAAWSSNVTFSLGEIRSIRESQAFILLCVSFLCFAINCLERRRGQHKMLSCTFIVLSKLFTSKFILSFPHICLNSCLYVHWLLQKDSSIISTLTCHLNPGGIMTYLFRQCLKIVSPFISLLEIQWYLWSMRKWSDVNVEKLKSWI